MSRHKTGYIISYHGTLCHDVLYVTAIVATLIHTRTHTLRITDSDMTTIMQRASHLFKHCLASAVQHKFGE